MIAQPEILWNVNYGSKTFDRGSSIIALDNNEYVVCGLTRQSSKSTNNGWLIKVDSVGSIIWEQNYFLGGHCWLRIVHQTVDGGFILGGAAQLPDKNWENWLIKTDSMGNILWEKSFGSNAVELLRDLKPTSDNGFIITGWGGADVYSGKFTMIKTDSLGEIIWSKSLFTGEGYGVIETSDNNYIATGTIDHDYICIIKLDSNGDEIWRNVFPNAIFGFGQDVIETQDGNFIAVGSEHNDIYWNHYYSRVIKFNNDGIILWEKKIEGPGALEFNSIIETNDG
ncbi:MAG: hypothetical protein R3250_08745, partial [Melioribacteraceae bacterium]|nr:hypothetical protein [Melioribacteraceae bacterium]